MMDIFIAKKKQKPARFLSGDSTYKTEYEEINN